MASTTKPIIVSVLWESFRAMCDHLDDGCQRGNRECTYFFGHSPEKCEPFLCPYVRNAMAARWQGAKEMIESCKKS